MKVLVDYWFCMFPDRRVGILRVHDAIVSKPHLRLINIMRSAHFRPTMYSCRVAHPCLLYLYFSVDQSPDASLYTSALYTTWLPNSKQARLCLTQTRITLPSSCAPGVAYATAYHILCPNHAVASPYPPRMHPLNFLSSVKGFASLASLGNLAMTWIKR
jgi:hypothetical protein